MNNTPNIELLHIDCMGKQKAHLLKIHHARIGKPLSDSTKLKISLGNKGKLKGRKRNPDSVAKTNEKNRKGGFFDCLKCGSKFWRQPSAIKKGQNKFCSKRCYQLAQRGIKKVSGFAIKPLSGDKNKNWKGGITPETVKIRNSKEYKEWRTLVFRRDNYTCQECKSMSCKGKNVYLEAHHIKPFATHLELRFDVNNGVTLCKQCHSLKPKGKKVYEQYNAA